jgi:hypothetical protein
MEPGILFELADQVADGAERGRVVAPRGSHAMLCHGCTAGPERHSCNFAAAEIDAQPQCGINR